MTTASKLKSAAVVEVRERKTKKEVAGKSAVKVVEVALDAKEAIGSTTASATKAVAALHDSSVQAENATSGSTAAKHFRAASMWATRLPVSFFSKNSPLFIRTQQNPVPLWRQAPERFLRAGRAA